MPSLLPGFEYDVFISYRQKDNKGERWVTEFVTALKTELESTFKERVSVYFDENPYEELVEKHPVQELPPGKLKSLIFIPILSRTYCDPQSHAWESEFKGFLAQSSKDNLGLNVGLADGHVASRVFPVRIHDLPPDDLARFESESGGVLRSIDFILKGPGINRPLLKPDKKEDNANHTSYRDQVSKVANGVAGILDALRSTATNLHRTTKNHAGQADTSKLFSKNNFYLAIIGLVILLALIYGVFQFI